MLEDIKTDDFGQKILLIAKEKFGSQKKMAEAIGVTKSSITDWVKGRSTPTFSTLKELCLKAEISLDWLVLGKTFESEVIDINLFNDVFKTATTLAIEENLDVNGAYYLGIYDIVKEYMKDNPKLTPKEIIDKNKKTIIKLRNI